MTKVSQDKFFGADERTLWDNRDAARKRLARPVGRTQEIDGRRYLRLKDYANWKGRSVKGKLVKEPGILAAAPGLARFGSRKTSFGGGGRPR